MGAGPRDSLMLVVLAAPASASASSGRRIEIAVALVGFALGGTVGIGTIAFAFGIGPAVELVFRLLVPRVGRRPSRRHCGASTIGRR